MVHRLTVAVLCGFLMFFSLLIPDRALAGTQEIQIVSAKVQEISDAPLRDDYELIITFNRPLTKAELYPARGLKCTYGIKYWIASRTGWEAESSPIENVQDGLTRNSNFSYWLASEASYLPVGRYSYSEEVDKAFKKGNIAKLRVELYKQDKNDPDSTYELLQTFEAQDLQSRCDRYSLNALYSWSTFRLMSNSIMVDSNLILEVLGFCSKGIANAALKDLYEQLKSSIAAKSSGTSVAETIAPDKLLSEYERCPSRWKQVLQDLLDEAKIAEDEEIAQIAVALSSLFRTTQTNAVQEFKNSGRGNQFNIGNTAIGQQNNVYNQHSHQEEFFHEVKDGVRTVSRFNPVTQSFSVVGKQLA